MNRITKKVNIIILLVAISAMLLVNVLNKVENANAENNIEFTNIQVSEIGGKQAEIRWSNNQHTYGKVIFGKAKDAMNDYIIDNSGFNLHHKVVLGNLEPQTTYYFQIIASNVEEREYSFIQSFTTEDYDDDITPVITNLQIPYKSGNVAVVTWQSDKPSNSVIEYEQSGVYYYFASNGNLVKDHMVILNNLIPGNNYKIRVYSTDKDNDKSNFFYKEFFTHSTTSLDNQDLIIKNFKPSSQNDSNITDKSITISFQTNHWAYGYINLGGLSETLDWGQNHEVTFSGLTPDTEYSFYMNLADVYSKGAEVRDLTIRTKPIQSNYTENSTDISPEKIIDGRFFYQDGEHYSNGDLQITDIAVYGFYENNSIILKYKTNKPSRAEGVQFYNTGESIQPKYTYNYVTDNEYKFTGINTSREYFMSVCIIDESGVKAGVLKGVLNTGKSYSGVSSNLNRNNSNQDYNSQNLNNLSSNVLVSGIDYSYYSRISQLIKTNESPDVYAIVNGQRHYISTPASFEEYGYSWNNIKTLSKEELTKYPRARLIKSPNISTIYYLYQRPENQWLKIALPSPTAFVSYPNNYWGNVITVTQLDVDSYPDVKLIKAYNDSAIFYLEDNIKYFISEEVFKQRDFSVPEIVEVSKVHLDTYKTGTPLK